MMIILLALAGAISLISTTIQFKKNIKNMINSIQGLTKMIETNNIKFRQ